MEEDRLPCVPPHQYGSDRESFERVWRRVMPEDRPDCPFTLLGEEACAAGELLTPPAAECTPGPQPQAMAMAMARPCPAMPAIPEPPVAPAVRQELLPEDNAPCLGCASAVYGGLLQSFIADELSDWRTYQALARRIGGGPGRTLGGIAADERRHAKRLSTAYFLISGVQYWPEQMPAVPVGAFLGALRARFAAEQRGEAAYRAAAAETTDACLKELYLELAGDEGEHAWLIRGILEQI